MDPAELWTFLPLGYALTVLIETPVLLLGLSRRHSLGRRLFAGVWLTACTYPIVVIVLPLAIDHHAHPEVYLLAAETFAPLAECLLFWAAFGTGQSPVWRDRSLWRDWLVIVAANLLSFLAGEVIFSFWTP
jgi:hypothetical protein